MSSEKALDFLQRHSTCPQAIDPLSEAERMLSDMERGLAGESSAMPMIPTYICNDGQLPFDRPVAVIDAGGTNFRSALVSFNKDGYSIEDLKKCKMPGIDKSAGWDEFISFVADNIASYMDKTDYIGFCFSYSAQITPDIDGKVICIDKEVRINDSAGKLVGASLVAELARRGIQGKRVVLLNDTVAVLLGGSALLDREAYSGFIGQVSGTGTNTCCALPMNRIGKLSSASDKSIIVNLESGMYDGAARGDFDLELDKASNNTGQKRFEKLTAGVYLGQLAMLILKTAAGEGLLARETAQKLQELGKIDSAVIDAWSCGEGLDELCANREDMDFVKTVCLAVFERSARCMCANLAALLMLTGAGRDKPALICAEGSLVQKGRVYRPMLESLLEEYAGRTLGRKFHFVVGQETTIPGSASAALLNINT